MEVTDINHKIKMFITLLFSLLLVVKSCNLDPYIIEDGCPKINPNYIGTYLTETVTIREKCDLTDLCTNSKENSTPREQQPTKEPLLSPSPTPGPTRASTTLKSVAPTNNPTNGPSDLPSLYPTYITTEIIPCPRINVTKTGLVRKNRN